MNLEELVREFALLEPARCGERCGGLPDSYR
jgi:hypothetical protein